MPPVPTVAVVRSVPEKKRGYFRNRIDRLLSRDNFHFELLLGTAVGVLVIVVLVVSCVVWTFRNQEGDHLRARTVEVLR
jgi:hypothetical protein